MYSLYQVQLETNHRIYSLEVPTNEFDAVELAEIHLAVEYDDYGPFHLGGYCDIGYSHTDEIVDNSNERYFHD